VNVIFFIQVLSYCYWTECPPLTLFIRRLPMPKRVSADARFFDCLLNTHWPHWPQSAEWGQKFFARSVRELIPTLSSEMLPLMLNECTGTPLCPVSNFMVERGGKRKWGRCSLKRMFWVDLTGVLGRVNFTQTCTGSGLFCPVPFCLPPSCPPKTKDLAPHM